jgi:tight adherence protein C
MEFLLIILPLIILALTLVLFKGPEVRPERISSIILGIEANTPGSQLTAKENGRQKRTRNSFVTRLYLSIKDKNSKSSEDIAKLLLRAGVRGENSVEVFRFTRLIAALSLGAIAMLIVVFGQQFSISQPLKILIVILAGAFGFFIPTILMINNAQKRRDEIKAGIPDMLDLMVICIQGGLSLEPALARVSTEIRFSYKVLSEELTSLNVELAYLGNRFQAYQNLQERVDLPEIKSLSSMMYQSERLGTPLSVAFNTLAAETRSARMSLAEKKAGALSSKLTVPMILFFVPAMFVVIMGPPILKLLNM